MKITMTGAIGRIGKVTTQLLVDRGHEVVAVDIADGPVPAGIKLHVGDLTDLDFADKVVAGSDAVIHMAGFQAQEMSANTTSTKIMSMQLLRFLVRLQMQNVVLLLTHQVALHTAKRGQMNGLHHYMHR